MLVGARGVGGWRLLLSRPCDWFRPKMTWQMLTNQSKVDFVLVISIHRQNRLAYSTQWPFALLFSLRINLVIAQSSFDSSMAFRLF